MAHWAGGGFEWGPARAQWANDGDALVEAVLTRVRLAPPKFRPPCCE